MYMCITVYVIALPCLCTYMYTGTRCYLTFCVTIVFAFNFLIHVHLLVSSNALDLYVQTYIVINTFLDAVV